MQKQCCLCSASEFVLESKAASSILSLCTVYGKVSRDRDQLLYRQQALLSVHFALLLQSRKETMLTKIDGAAMDSETVQMLSIIDEEKDANIIINSEGVIQFANKGVTTVCPPAQT